MRNRDVFINCPGGTSQKRKKCIIFESRPYLYQQFISDIAGQDIHSHQKSVAKLVEKTSAWLRAEPNDHIVPGGKAILADLKSFQKIMPALSRDVGLRLSELTFKDYARMAERWLVVRPQ